MTTRDRVGPAGSTGSGGPSSQPREGQPSGDPVRRGRPHRSNLATRRPIQTLPPMWGTRVCSPQQRHGRPVQVPARPGVVLRLHRPTRRVGVGEPFAAPPTPSRAGPAWPSLPSHGPARQWLWPPSSPVWPMTQGWTGLETLTHLPALCGWLRLGSPALPLTT